MKNEKIPKKINVRSFIFIFFLLANCFVIFLLTNGIFSKDKQNSETGIQVVVDPRVELMSIIWRLSGVHPPYSQNTLPIYIEDIEKHFGKFKDHPAVEKLRQSTKSLSFNCPMDLAIHLENTVTLKEKVPFEPHPAGLDKRWIIADARDFLVEARNFVKDTDFNSFFEDHQDLYDLSSNRMEQIIQENKVVEWLEGFFSLDTNETHTIVLGMGNGGANYGPRIYYPDGRQEMYAILGIWRTDDRGLPRFEDKDQPQFKIEILSTIIHEFIHSYTNPLVDRHESDLKKAGEKLFQIVAVQMSRQAYGIWKTMMYETLVRASTIRYLKTTLGEKYAKERLDRESKKRYFLWLEELVPLLEDYETSGETYPNLEAFFPRITAFFNDYVENIDQIKSELDNLLKQARKDWEAKAPRVLVVDPANGSQDVDPDRKTITISFDRPMYKGNWGFRPGPKTPKDAEKEAIWDPTGKVHTLYVELEPDKEYELWLNEEDFLIYMSTEKVHLVPYKISFKTRKCFGSARFGQMRAFLKLQIICNNLKRGEMHDNQSKVENFT